MARNKYPEVTVGRILDVSMELFFEKGYDFTTIQDIIDALGDLSKGAIYHHFKSKDDIMIAGFNRLNVVMAGEFSAISNDKTITGIQKLRKIFITSLKNPDQEMIVKTFPDILKNPRFLAMQVDRTLNDIAPNIIEPIVKEGIADGTIKTEFPKELSEVIMLLLNIWLNPFLFNVSKEDLYGKYQFFKSLMESLNIYIITEE